MHVSPEVYARHRYVELKPLIDRMSRIKPSRFRIEYFPVATAELEQMTQAIERRRPPDPIFSEVRVEAIEDLEASLKMWYQGKLELIDHKRLERMMALLKLLAGHGYTVLLEDQPSNRFDIEPLRQIELDVLGVKGDPPLGGTMLVICFEAQA